MREAGRASLQQANEMIRFADVKAAAVLAAAGVLGSRLPAAHDFWADGVLVIADTCVLVSALLALYTLVPQRQVTTVWSLLYHENIARRYGGEREAFVEAWLEMVADERAFEQEVAAQIWAVNIVAHRKFTRIAWSIRVLVVGVVAVATVALN